MSVSQPPSGGCVLKPFGIYGSAKSVFQPPSGGCVLKQFNQRINGITSNQPPSGGCVLKHLALYEGWDFVASRLRAAVC